MFSSSLSFTFPSSSPLIISHICCLNIHWQLSACWMLIPKTDPKQQIRKWNFTAKDQIPPHGEKVTKNSIRGKCHCRNANLTVWLVTLLRLALFGYAHPTGVCTCSEGSTPTCRLGAWTSCRSSMVPKEILKFESNSPNCCKLSSFLLPTLLSSALTQEMDSVGSLVTRLNPIV